MKVELVNMAVFKMQMYHWFTVQDVGSAQARTGVPVSTGCWPMICTVRPVTSGRGEAA